MPVPRVISRFIFRFGLLVMLIACFCWLPTHDAFARTSRPAGAQPDFSSGIPPHQFAGNNANLYTTESFTVTLTVNTQAAVVGGTLVYTLTLMNNSTASAAFDVTDRLTDNLMLIDAPGMTASDHVLSASGTLPSDAQQQFVITAQIHTYRIMVENAATVRIGSQTHTIAAPAVRVASAASSSVHYLPMIMQ